MENIVDLKIPILFEKINTYKVEDTRFIPVKIWLMHLGENLNGSYFTKESVIKAIPSLANTPILAFIEEKNDEIDFSDHRLVLERKGEDIKLSYKGKAIGTIPESNNAHFEERLCDDGIMREFLVCDALVWNKWEDSTEILNRDLIKSQSMELDDSYTGFFNSNGYFEFQIFKFFGACALGEDVTPAMRNSTIEVNFTMQEIETKLHQFTNFLNQSSFKEVDIDDLSKGGINVEDEKKIIVDEVITEIVEEVVTEETIEEIITEVVVDETKEDFATVEVVTEIVTDFSNDLSELQVKYDGLLQEFNDYKQNYSTPNSEVEVLVTYQNKKMSDERKDAEDIIFNKYEEKIGDTSEFEELKTKVTDFTLEALEKECIYIVGLHTEFAKEIKKSDTPHKFSIEKEINEEKDVYGGLFKKHLNK